MYFRCTGNVVSEIKAVPSICHNHIPDHPISPCLTSKAVHHQSQTKGIRPENEESIFIHNKGPGSFDLQPLLYRTMR